MVGVRVPLPEPADLALRDRGCRRRRDGVARRARRDRRVQHRAPLGGRGVDGPARRAPGVAGRAGSARRSCARASRGCEREGATVIGLETMPRTMDNIGFYSALGFLPGRLTITLTLDAARGGPRPPSCSGDWPRATGRTRSPSAARSSSGSRRATTSRARSSSRSRSRSATRCSCATAGASSASRSATRRRSWRGARARSCACSSSRWRTSRAIDAMLRALCDFARRSGTRRVALRVQGEYPGRVPHDGRARGARALDRPADGARRVRGAAGTSAGSCCRTGRSERADACAGPDSFQGIVHTGFRPRRRIASG